MGFIIILIALAVQHYGHFTSYQYRYNWMERYFNALCKRKVIVATRSPLLTLIILVVPVLLVVGLLFGLCYQFFGNVGYFLLSLALVWYCLDARNLKKHPVSGHDAADMFHYALAHVFSILFWYYVFGPVGLALYFSVDCVRNVVQPQADGDGVNALSAFLQQVMAILNWVPVRLVGISFAVVGHFGKVFKLWLQKLVSGLKDANLVVEFGQAALENKSELQAADAAVLIERAIWVWLVAMALISIGVLIG